MPTPSTSERSARGTWEAAFAPGSVPFVLLHGLGLNRTYFRPFAEILQGNGIGSVSVDLPGHGRSRGVPARCLDDAASRVLEVLDGLGIDAFVPFGYSYGGMVALALHRLVPARIPGIVLAATSYAAGPGTVRWSFALLGLALCKAVNWSVWLRDPLGNPDLDFSEPAIVASDLRCLVASSRATSAADMAAATSVLTGESMAAHLPGVRVPTLLLQPTGDQIFSKQSYDRLTRELPRVRRVRIPGTHHIAREWPTIGARVVAFLEESRIDLSVAT